MVAATNQDLGRLVSAKQFRADLYYCLNVIPIFLPPLRERLADIPRLVEHFVKRFSTRLNKPIDAIPEEVMECLKSHDWPGNVRELQNFIERSIVFSAGSELRPTLTEVKRLPRQEPSAVRTLADAERDHILEALEQTNWLIGSQNGAAARLGLPRTTLIHRMRKLGIETPRSRRQQWSPQEPRAVTRGVSRQNKFLAVCG